ncbi:MAG: transposase, partial [Desulfobacteraceae bacterium]|nr:transposase [Desulfobacteraceae bacterium]
MARANRHFIPGYIWHITHRCHKKEFLLKLVKDRERWMYWLFQSKKRYGLCILNYMVTSNHIHLLVIVTDNGKSEETIPRSVQLIAGRTGQEYNQRKKRKGAFWEDRYHATAVQSNEHLIQCLIYIDMNMVRAGIVKHPKEWPHSGYNEIQNPGKRYSLIDRKKLMKFMNISDYSSLQQYHRKRIEDTMERSDQIREIRWTQSIAVGDMDFVGKTKALLEDRAKGRKITNDGDTY